MHGHLDIVDLILQNSESKGIDIQKSNNYGNTPFHLACLHGKHKIVPMLLEKYKEKSIKIQEFSNNDGNSPLHLAYIHGKRKIVEVLLQSLEDK